MQRPSEPGIVLKSNLNRKSIFMPIDVDKIPNRLLNHIQVLHALNKTFHYEKDC